VVITTTNGVIATGATEAPGGAHGEIVALRAAGDRARGATLYTTLEPCHHVGRTGPCTNAIIDAGITRVVIGIVDPDDHVSGRGVAALRQAGIQVDVGVCAEVVSAQLEPYLYHRRTKRPFVVLKMASTIDGRTSAGDGTSQWITGEDARRRVHELRAESDAILVGAGTVRADNPHLNVRDVEGASPRRIVLGKIDVGAHVHPCLEYSGELTALLDTLGNEGVLQLLVEGGPRVAASFHNQGLVNRYIIHIAPAIAGGDDANPVFRGPGAGTMAEMWHGRIVSTSRLGDDLEIVLEPRISASPASTEGRS
jgi:diaminohydroxyphosphoribosylaminopyrimidine deaminase/5-amino-6-(5-phosphoribosylamino)uracil reductase